MSAASWVEWLLALADLTGLCLLCWFDPAGYGEAERKRREAERAGY